MNSSQDAVVSIKDISKTYSNGFVALRNINLEIRRGEILALLGPNGAGKTTLINVITGIANASSGSVTVNGHDIIKDYRKARSEIGLVPQELSTDMFTKVHRVLAFSRGLFGKGKDDAKIEQVLRDLSLWDKRDSQIRTLSGGMKRRVLIAKALSHEPQILFLDEPTAGVDVSLRREMWTLVRRLRESGVTIILTTHYIEEAQEMADRIGVINKGEIIVVEEKANLMRKLGKKRLILNLAQPMTNLPKELEKEQVQLAADGSQITFTFDSAAEHTGIPRLMKVVSQLGLEYHDLQTRESTLEEIFVSLVAER